MQHVQQVCLTAAAVTRVFAGSDPTRKASQVSPHLELLQGTEVCCSHTLHTFVCMPRFNIYTWKHEINDLVCMFLRRSQTRPLRLNYSGNLNRVFYFRFFNLWRDGTIALHSYKNRFPLE